MRREWPRGKEERTKLPMDDGDRKRIKRKLYKVLGLEDCVPNIDALRHVAEALGCDVSSLSALEEAAERKTETETETDDDGSVDGDVLEDEFARPMLIEQPGVNDSSSSVLNSLAGSGERSLGPHEYMEWLLHPLQLEDFFEHLFEQQPALIRRPFQAEYFVSLLSFNDVCNLLAGQGLQYGMDLDVTRYDKNGGRQTFNYNKTEDQKALNIANHSLVLKRFHKRGCSIRLRRPALHFPKLRRLMGFLEEFWQVPVGANVYLTPPGSQGFAPHFDDIDAFVIQVEGTKVWRLYAPTDPRNVLPRRSSRDFKPQELGTMTMEVVLQPGDTLYLPRGCVHEAQSLPEAHSMHITLSVNQDSSWQRLFEAALPRAIALASSKWRALRAAVPRDLNLSFGTAPLAQSSPDNEVIDDWLCRRQEVETKCQELLALVANSFDLDWAADQFKTEFLSKRLPPEDLDRKKNKKKRKNRRVLGPCSEVYVCHPGTTQLVVHADDGENTVSVVSSVHNDIEYHVVGRESEEVKRGGLEFPAHCTPVLLSLLGAPGHVLLSDLCSHDDEEQAQHSVVEIAQKLWDAGLLC